MKNLNLSIIAAFAALFATGLAMGAASRVKDYNLDIYNRVMTPPSGKANV